MTNTLFKIIVGTLQYAPKKQQELEKNLLCAKSIDTGKCSCYDKRSGNVVSMSLEQCNHYVDQQFSSY